MPPKDRPSRPFFDERTEPDSLRPDSPLPPPPPPRAAPRRADTPAAMAGFPSVVSLAIDIRELKTKVEVHEGRIDRLENRTETTGQHDVNDLKQKLRDWERKDEQRKREDQEREDADQAKRDAEAAGAKKEAEREAAAQTKARKESRDRKLELVLAALVGGAVSFGVQSLKDCATKPVQPQVIVPVSVPAATSAK